MLDVLYQAENALPKLLSQSDRWHSLLIDYHKPYVQRVWCNWGEYRINLHQISSCDTTEALFHPHPWPSAMRLVSGEYKMGVGYTTGKVAPACAATIVLNQGSAYEMVQPNGWHYVQPLTNISLSVMVTGKPWTQTGSEIKKHLSPLSKTRQQELLDLFSEYYNT